jgi:hypothetical protein
MMNVVDDDDDWIAGLTDDEFDEYFGCLTNVLIGHLVELVEVEVALERWADDGGRCGR